MQFLKVLFLTSVCSLAMAQDPRVYYMHLMPEMIGETVKIHGEPMLFSNSGKPIQDIFLSQVIQDAVIHLRNNEAEAGGRDISVFRFPIFLKLRPLNGEKGQFLKSHFDLGFGSTGFFRVTAGEIETNIAFHKMSEPEFYPQIFRAIMQAFAGQTFEAIDSERFVVELFHSFPNDQNRFLAKGYPHNRAFMKHQGMLQLGIAWCKQTPGGIQAVNLAQLLTFEKNKLLLQESQNAAKVKDMETTLAKLETYFEHVPSSGKVAHILADLYMAQDREKALAFMLNYQPYFGHFFQAKTTKRTKRKIVSSSPHTFTQRRDPRVSTSKSYSNHYDYHRKGAYKKLLKKIPNATLSDSHQVWIANPVANDLVAGEVLVEAVAWSGSEEVSMLQADCLVNGKVLDSQNSLPLRFRVKIPNGSNQEIRARVYFEDGTYAEEAIRVEGLPVDEETRVPASRLQVVGSHKGKALDFDKGQLRVMEDGKSIKPGLVHQDQQPVDLAIMIDTSTTMAHRLHIVKSAVYELLENMKEGETASIYTFDEKVALLARYDGNLEEVESKLFTLTGYGTTSLNDAVVVARTRLLTSLKATKAIIVIGDGDDTSSMTSGRAVIGMLKGAPMRLYSIDVGMGARNISLKSLAFATGGTYTHVDNYRNFGGDLIHILDELRNLYFVTYQGLKESPKTVHAEVKGKKLRTVRVTN